MVQTRRQRKLAGDELKPDAPDAEEEVKERLSLYGRLLRRFPLATNGVQAGFLSFTSNLLAQHLKGSPALDYAPALRFALISALVVTPVSTVFFTIVGSFKLKTPASLTLDFFVGGPVLNCAFIAALHLLQGDGVGVVAATLQSRAFWTDMVLGSNKVWLPAKVAMYTLVPMECSRGVRRIHESKMSHRPAL